MLKLDNVPTEADLLARLLSFLSWCFDGLHSVGPVSPPDRKVVVVLVLVGIFGAVWWYVGHTAGIVKVIRSRRRRRETANCPAGHPETSVTSIVKAEAKLMVTATSEANCWTWTGEPVVVVMQIGVQTFSTMNAWELSVNFATVDEEVSHI